MSLRACKQEHCYELVEKRWFFDCPLPPRRGKRKVLTRVAWKRALFFRNILFIFLRKNLNMKFWHCLYQPCSNGSKVLLQKGSLLFAPGARLFSVHSPSSAGMPEQYTCHTAFQEIPSSGGLLKRQPNSGSTSNSTKYFFPHNCPKCFSFYCSVFREKK